MGRLLKCRYLVILVLCSGCFPDRATIDPYAYAPTTSSSVWKPREKKPEVVATPIDSTPLTLGEILDIALQNNPDTKLTWAQARYAAAQYGQSESYQFPTLSGSYTWQRSRSLSATGSTNTDTATPLVITDSNPKGAAAPLFISQWGPQLDLSYILFDFGQHRATSEAARQALYFADFTHNRQIQTILQQVTSDYYNYLYQKELLVANEADLKTAEVTFNAVKLSLENGVKDISDLLQAQTQLLQAKVQLISQKQQVTNTLATLLTDMGLKANFSLEVAPVPEIPPTDEMLETADQLLVIAMQKRADLLAAEANLRAQEANVVVAKRQFLPTFQYNLNFGQTSYTKVGSDGYDFTSTFSLSFPIFTGFSNMNNLRAAEAQMEQAKASLHQAELQVVEEITVSHTSVKSAFETLKFSTELLQTTEKQYEVALARYRSGVGTILELTNAQSSLAEARAGEANSIKQWFTALVNLSYAAGTLDPPIPSEVR